MSVVKRLIEGDFIDLVNIVSDAYPAFKINTQEDKINKLFFAEDKPVCMTAF